MINRLKPIAILAITVLLYLPLLAQQTGHAVSLSITFDHLLAEQFSDSGRLFVFLNQNPNVEPRTRTWPTPGNFIFAHNFNDLSVSENIVKDALSTGNWDTTADWDFSAVPPGTYYVQAVWHQQFNESRMVAPGNLFSVKQELPVSGPTQLDINISEVVPPRRVTSHPHVKTIDFVSDTLSNWWQRPINLKATVLLP